MGLIQGLDILTKEIIEKKSFEIKGTKTKFISIVPHSGLIIPSNLFDNLILSDPLLEEMINDSDPFTNLFNLEEIEGKSFIYNIHRSAGDANRYTNDNSFIKGKSFRGHNYLKKEIEKNNFKYLCDLANNYSAKISDEISKFKEKYNGPLFLIHLHAMEEFDPLKKSNRPDLCLSVGKNNKIISDYFKEIVVASFEDVYSGSLDFEINNPFNGLDKTNRLIDEHSDPKNNVHSFMIEFNKRIFMNEFKLNYDNFQELKIKLHSAINNFLDYINR